MINNNDIYDVLIQKKIIKEKHVEILKKGLSNFNFQSNAYLILLKHGFSLKNIMKAEAFYGEDLEKVINNNPYQLIIDIDGIGFKTIDKLALNLGFKEDDKRRIKAAILYCLNNLCHMTGDTYKYIDDIYKELNRLIPIDYDSFKIYLDEVINDALIVKIDDKYFPRNLYVAEHNIANCLKEFINRKINTRQIDKHFDAMIAQIEEDEGISYSDEQKDAIYGALSNGIYIITGGPGTGKTTILNAILKILRMLYGENSIISLCAPTGRASKRMSILSNNYACTIHRLLKWDLHSNSFAYNANNKLHSDVIIIDEFSMVDTLLFEALLVGTTNVGQIILIGDDGQLPSVGAGNLLYDLLRIDSINKMALSKIYRQSDDSSIITLAYKIRNDILDESFRFSRDVSFFKMTNTMLSNSLINLLEKFFESGYTFDDIQIIIPMYRGVAGIDNVNSIIQNWYNKKDDNKNEIRVGHQIFREGDRVLQLKNQPEDDIYNGDIGVIDNIDLIDEEVEVSFDVGPVIYQKQNLNNLTLAYAISIHKSQGSEFKYVIMPIFSDYGYMLDKQLVYTGITRAKSSLVLLGDYKTFIKSTHIKSRIKRKTGLLDAFNNID